MGVTGSEVGIGKTSLEVGRGCFPLFPVPQQTSQWLGSGTTRMGDPPLIQGPAPIPQTSLRPQQPHPHTSTSHTGEPWAVFHLPLSLHWETALGPAHCQHKAWASAIFDGRKNGKDSQPTLAVN